MIHNSHAFQDEGDFSSMGKDFEEYKEKLFFYRCASKAVIEGCIDYEFHHNEEKFDLSGLGDSFPDLDDAKKRWVTFSAFVNYDTMGLWDGVLPEF